MPKKPKTLFGREAEWNDLASFTADDTLGATLAIVYGRRRQGKTLMLELLTEVTGGFMFTGLEQSTTLNLRGVSDAYRAFTKTDAPVGFESWAQVVEALLALGETDRPVPIVIDELPYLTKTAPELPSIIQQALSPRGRARQQSRARLILCGSAFSVMRELLSGTAALRGRAPRELVVHPFGFREAGGFWGIKDLKLAVQLHALCGGTPAYLDFAGGDRPADIDDLDRWVVAHLLNPSSAFFREGRILLAEEPEVTDLGLCFSVLTAIATGRTRRGQIAAVIGRPETALAHPLQVLEETRLVERREDALRQRRSTWQIAEPMLRFHQLIVNPYESRLARRAGAKVWAEVAGTVSSLIYGPHFEHLAREWVTEHASAETLGGSVSTVGTTVVPCREHGVAHEVDVVAVERIANRSRRVLAIGEAKWRRDPVSQEQLVDLRHVRDLLVAGSDDAPPPRLLLFSASGFTRSLMHEARRAPDVELVDLPRLYRGS